MLWNGPCVCVVRVYLTPSECRSGQKNIILSDNCSVKATNNDLLLLCDLVGHEYLQGHCTFHCGNV